MSGDGTGSTRRESGTASISPAMPLVSRFLGEGLLGALLYIRPKRRERGEVREGSPGEVDARELVGPALPDDDE